MSPVPEVKKLTKASSPEQAKAAISSCIATEIRNGMSQEQAVAACTNMVKEQMGREMMPEKEK